MTKWAEIKNNCIRYIYESDEKPIMESSIVLVDITRVKPEPQVGWSYIDEKFIKVEKSNNLTMDIIRNRRNKLIEKDEWIINHHIQQKALGVEPALTEEKFYEWLHYFELLRNITNNDINKIVWPKRPE